MSLCRTQPRVWRDTVAVALVGSGSPAVASVAPFARLFLPSPQLRGTLRVFSNANGNPNFSAASWTLRPLHNDVQAGGKSVDLPAIFTSRSLLSSPYADSWELATGMQILQAEFAVSLGTAVAGTSLYLAAEIQPSVHLPVEYWEELYSQCRLQALPSEGLRLA